MKTLRLGTRASKLALWQANWVRTALLAKDINVEIVPVTTSGDRSHAHPIVRLGATGVFTREIQKTLLNGETDLAVHSLKDLPTETVPGLVLAAVPLRADHRDVFVSPHYASPDDLPDHAKVGSGSMRRGSQLLNLQHHRIQVEDIRGNVETRLAKLDRGEYDALILAAAGLTRLELGDRIRFYLEPPQFLPAPGQGALAIETREDDVESIAAVQLLDHHESHLAVLAERALLAFLEGGCIAPIGTWARLENSNLTLMANILTPDGTKRMEAVRSIAIDLNGSYPDLKRTAEQLGRDTAQDLLDRGAQEIIELVNALRS